MKEPVFDKMRQFLMLAEASATVAQASDSMFEILADWIDAIVWITKASGELVFVNRYWTGLTRLELKETIDLGWMNVIHPDDAEALKRARARQLEQDIPMRTGFRVLDPDAGTYRWYKAQSARIVDGKSTLWFGIATPEELWVE